MKLISNHIPLILIEEGLTFVEGTLLGRLVSECKYHLRKFDSNLKYSQIKVSAGLEIFKY